MRIPARIQSAFLLLIYAGYLLVPSVHDWLHAVEKAAIADPRSRLAAQLTSDCAGTCGDPTHHHDRIGYHGTCVLCVTQIKTPHRHIIASPGSALTHPCGGGVDFSDTLPAAFFLRIHSIRGPPQTSV